MMIDKDYPLYQPRVASGLLFKGATELSPQEAREYLDWMQQNFIPRTDRLLASVGLNFPLSQSDWSTLEQRVLQALDRAEFSFPTPNGPSLTPLGESLGADLGLILARHLLARSEKLSWSIGKKKKYVDFNLPIIVGFIDGMALDPVRIGMVAALRLLRTRDVGDFRRGRERWQANVPS